jgi:hypothetical protein
MMVDKDWTFEDAKAAHDAAIADGADGPTLPLFQWNALQEIDQLKVAYENGDKMALFAAMRKCANHDLIMPPWVSRGFISGYDSVLTCRVGSWDDAFGRPYPKGKHLVNMQQDRLKRYAIYFRIKEIIEAERHAIDDGLFERAGSEFGVSKSSANRLYYEAQKMFLPRKA